MTYYSARRGCMVVVRQPEKAIEERVAAYYQGHADTLSVTRQMRFADGSKADIVVEALLPEDPPIRLVTVIEVKADKADHRAMAQLSRYLRNMRAIIQDESEEDEWWQGTMLAGMLAAPRFSSDVEDYAARCGYDDTLFSIMRVAT